MADTKITAFPEATTIINADILPIVNDTATTPANKKITFENFKTVIPKEPTFIVGTANNCDYTDIQDAIDALPAGGGKIFILAGTYSLTATITIAKDNVFLEGEGPATVITQPNATNINLITLGDGASPYVSIAISNLKLDANKANNTTNSIGINILNYVGQVLIDNCFFTGSENYCIYSASTGSNFIVTLCTFETSEVHFYATGSSIFTFISNIFYSAARSHLYLNNCRQITITNNIFDTTVSYPPPYGSIFLETCTDIVVATNTIKNAKSYGIYLSFCKRFTCTGNVISGCQLVSLLAGNSFYGAIGANLFYNNVQGLGCSYSSIINVTGNTILTTNREGINIAGCSDFSLSGNVVQDFGLSYPDATVGLLIGTVSSRCTVVGNTVVLSSSTRQRGAIWEYNTGTDYNMIGHNITKGVFYRHIYAFGRNSEADSNITHYV